MLNFDMPRYLQIQSGAVGLADRLASFVRARLDTGIRNIHFAGTGGVALLMSPAVQLLRQKSTLPIYNDFTPELLLGNPVNLGPDSLVVMPSLSGTTRESVELLDLAKNRGATVMTLVGHEDTPLGKQGSEVFVNFAADDTSSESFYIQALTIALSVLDHRGEMEGVVDILGEFRKLPQALVETKRAFESRAVQVADALAGSDYHIFTGAGATWPEAFYYGMCILEEMQWIRTRPVHASDFFHGTLELIDKDVSVVLLKGEDEYRPICDRVENFAGNYTTKLTVLDAKDLALPGIDARARRLLSPVILAAALERVSAHLEQKRNHPLETRRYYKRVAY